MSNDNGKDYGELFNQVGEVIRRILKQCDDEGKVVEFVGSFVVMDPEKEFEVIADTIFSYGVKDSLKIALEGILEDIDKEEDDFVNW